MASLADEMPVGTDAELLGQLHDLISLGRTTFNDPPSTEFNSGLQSSWLVKASEVMVSRESVQCHPVITFHDIGEDRR